MTDKDPTLLPDLKKLVESTTRGDPESPLLWTARSQRNLVAALKKQGHQTSMKRVARLLKDLGYSLQGNRKRLEGAGLPSSLDNGQALKYSRPLGSGLAS
jgi:transposase